ncbi:iron uptake system component EfeO [Tistlia consotensis]|uniref:Iron uptake system component EfeO n=1 Tax=Tistlia consotensis USBA 355 TaxID=560819 RepID=A0A1Y6B9Q6_9PROT|nr:iron uptake system protein EfeO [Tistlia consotensis]SME96715.1 iron uptake system component EfeO [Tistlia consotensis USBA 355]SNR56069.1 iron uptake system component EfeO [Tistlia consotensis]
MKLNRLLAGSALALAVGLPGLAAAKVEPSLELVQPLADYKIYISEKLQKLVDDTTAFTAAIEAGELDKAKALYAPTRASYEAVEPVAELFGDLDAAIDARADDFEKREKDPNFTGFHRLEYGLWEKDSTKGLAPVADKLLADVTELQGRVVDLPLPPEKVVGGAADLMNEVAASKISGEEDRYSHSDLWDFQANVDGAEKIFELVEPLVAKDDPAFVQRVSANFKTVDDTLAKYRAGQGFELYDKLSESDRTVLSAAVNTLAEDLATLRGKLGLN